MSSPSPSQGPSQGPTQGPSHGPTHAPPQVRAARAAVYAAFALAGVAFATWASRLPTTRDSLGLSPQQLGLLLLCVAAGSVLALPTAGPVASRVGTARTVQVGGAVCLTGLAFAGVASSALGSVPLTALGLFVLGLGTGGWDVAMNLEGALVERQVGRAIMPGFHAAFSGGTVLAAGVGAAAAWLEVPVWAHGTGVATLSLAALLLSSRAFLPDADPDPDPEEPEEPAGSPGTGSALGAWLEPRTLLVGVLVLSAAFTEGTANDWMSVALVDGYGASPAVGAVGLAVFLSAMTAARLGGQRALDRWGRVPVLRVATALGGVGALLVVFGTWLPLALVGAVLWGAGAALGFPVGISAAADDPTRAAVRVSVVTTIGYTAFLAGPPLLGFLGEHVGVLDALLVVALVAVPSLLVSRVAEPPDDGVAEPPVTTVAEPPADSA